MCVGAGGFLASEHASHMTGHAVLPGGVVDWVSVLRGG